MTQTKPATSLPWKTNDGRGIYACDRGGVDAHIAESVGDIRVHARPNAAYIVTACNNFPRCVDALKDAYSTVHPEMPAEYRAKLARIGDLLREMGEL
jgi:hypothetical protein